MKIFPELPQDLSALTDEELQAAITERQALVERAVARDPELLGDLDKAEVLKQTTEAVAAIQSLKDEATVRAETEETFDAELAKLAEAAGKPEVVADADEAKADEATEEAVAEVVAEAEAVTEAAAEAAEAPAEPEAEVVAETVAEPILAAGHTKAARAGALPRPEAAPIVVEPEGQKASLVAAAGVPGIADGAQLDKAALAQAMFNKRNQGSSMPPGYQEKVLVASMDYSSLYPEERRLYGDAGDNQKIQDVVSPEALVASGGLCAPVTPYYELQYISTAARPVRDAVPSFNAVRGGLRFAAPPVIGDVTGVGVKTAAQDAAGGTFATKTTQVVSCPSFSEVDLEMIYHSVQFGNLNSRAWPEQIAQFNDLVMAAHARVAEEALLDYIDSTSTAVTDAGNYGAYSGLQNAIAYAAAGIRSRNRMPLDAKLRVLLPGWVGDLIAADLTNRQFPSDFRYTRDDVKALLSKNDVIVDYYLDTATGGGQIFGAQSAGALLRFPATVIWYIFPEGSYLFLDGGTLELGIVRDSTLNSTNDFQIWGESFEAMAFIGAESLKVTSTVCPTGETGPTATAITCS